MRKNLPNTSVPCGCRRREPVLGKFYLVPTPALLELLEFVVHICILRLMRDLTQKCPVRIPVSIFVAFFDLPRRPLGDSVYFRTSGVTQSFIWDWLCDWIERDLSEPVCCFLRGLYWLLFLSLRQSTWQKQFHRESVYLGSQLEVQLIDGSRR